MRDVLIADDHEVTRRGIGGILRDAFEGIELVEAFDADSLRAALPLKPWNLVMLDVIMPGATVIENIKAVRERHPTVPLLVLTGATEISYVTETMKAGANGLVHKHRASDVLLEAIEQVSTGGAYLDSETAIAVAASLHDEPPEAVHQKLSARELEIFRLIALGRAIKEIAGDLNLSEKTVATYLSRIREKTGLTSHVEIARYALHNGLVD